MSILNKTKKGFTLIELLVAIAIIGILASIVLVNLNSTRKKANDTKRKADFKQIRNAIALYYNINNQYPNCPSWVYSNQATWNTTSCLATALSSYISKLPVDPKNNTAGPWVTGRYTYAYVVKSDRQNYDLVTQLEIQTDNDRCGVKLWKYHYAGDVASWCSPTYNYSPYLYSDH